MTHNHILTKSMDKAIGNKRKALSPSPIDQVENNACARLCGSEHRYTVTEEWKGSEHSVWDQLHTAFPASSTLQAKVDISKFYLNYSGCPNWCVSMDCVCFNCTQMRDTYIMYAHRLMEEAILANMPVPGHAAPINILIS